MIAIVIVEVVAVIIILARLVQVCCNAPPAEPTLIALSIGATSSPTDVQKPASQTPQVLASQTADFPTEIVPTATPTLIPDTATASATLVPPSPTATRVLPTEEPATVEPTTALPATVEPPTKAPPTNLPPVPVSIVFQPTVPIPTAIPTTAPSPTKLPPTARPVTATPRPPSATPTVTATATDEPCYYAWAIHPLPDITNAAQSAITNAGLNTVTVTAEAYGEDCIDGKTGASVGFGAMSTDFYLIAPVSDFSDADAMAALVKTAYQTLTTLPISLPALPGYLDIKFTTGAQTKEFRGLFRDVKVAIDAGKSSAELLAVGGL